MYDHIKIVSLTLLALSAPYAFATGGFSCGGKTEAGDNVAVGACLSWASGSICNDPQVHVNGKLVHTFVREAHALNSYSGSGLLAVQIMDSQVNDTFLRLEYVEGVQGRSHLEVTVPTNTVPKTYLVKDLVCEIE